MAVTVNLSVLVVVLQHSGGLRLSEVSSEQAAPAKEALSPIAAVSPVEALSPVEAVSPVQAVSPLEAISPMVPARAVSPVVEFECFSWTHRSWKKLRKLPLVPGE